MLNKNIKNNKAKIDLFKKFFDYFLLVLILGNSLAIVLESYENIYYAYYHWFRYFEIFSILIFTIEYIIRLLFSNNKIRYFFSPLAIVDLLSILPFYLSILFPLNLSFLRILRLTRVMRILKLNRYSNSLSLIFKIVRDKSDELLSTLFLMLFIILFSSTLMYYVESSAQPDVFSNIVETFWWSVATLTTVGYGDIYPITGMGKFLSSIIAILGIGLIALPTGIISSGFMDEIRKKDKTCPHCKKRIE